MTLAPGELERMLKQRQREVRFVTSFVILALAAGGGLLWPSVQQAAIDRFGPFFPTRVLGGELLALVVLFIIYLWRKTSQIERLIERLITESGRGRQLEELLSQARAVLEASMQLNLDDDAAASLQKILQCVTESLRADRGVLWRQRTEGRAPDREAVFPSTTEAPDPLAIAFEDEVARRTIERGQTIVIDEGTELDQYEIEAARPRKGWKRLVAAPLVVEGKPVGALMLCNPESVGSEAEQDPESSSVGLLEIFAGFAAGVLRNLRVFQTIARRNSELMRARQLLCDHQRELAEIDAVATMSRVAKSLAHGMSGPLTAISGYTDVVLTTKPDALTLQGAREGLRREIDALKQRLHKVVEFTQTWRRAYGVVDLNQVVETAVALHSEPLRARGVTCRFDPHPGLPYTVADPVRLRQVFLCLLSFVRGALREGSSAEMRVRTLADSGTLLVYIDFPGRAGLTELVAPLLDPNVEVTTLARERNLDLPVAVSILRDHRGDLEIETLEDLGTRIIVQLPVLSEAPELHPAEPDPDVSLDEVLNRIFGDDAESTAPVHPMPQRRVAAAAAPVQPRHTPVSIAPPHHAAAAPVATAAPMMMSPEISPLRPTGDAAKPAAAAAKPAMPVSPLAKPAQPAAPAKPVQPMAPAASRPAAPVSPSQTRPAAPASPAQPLPPPATGPEGAGLNELFQPSEMWRGAPPIQAPKRPVEPTKDAPSRFTLLEHAEVEGALKLFDEAEQASNPPKE
jgi:C4-dicarboxylate-specific signal transduction histidine kinase